MKDNSKWMWQWEYDFAVLSHPDEFFCRIYEHFAYINTCTLPATAWWRHQMETFSVLLAICAGNSPVPGEFPAQRPVTRSFHVCLICAWINRWVNNREAGDLRRYRAHYDVIVMGEEYSLIWTLIWIYCKADTFLHILWNAKHLCMFVENKYLF